MKKIIFILILFIVYITNLQALSKFSLGEKVPNMYIESHYKDKVHNGAPFVIRKDDGTLAYCINPYDMINTEEYYYEYDYNNELFHLSDDQLNRLNIISYYGYNYEGHQDLKWYGITQYLIWKTLNPDDIFFTDVYYGNKIVAYEEEIEELETLVKNYFLLPSIANQYFEYKSNGSYELVDLNHTLSNYEIISSNIDAKINGNSLNIITSSDGLYELTFIRRSPQQTNYMLYNLDGYQAVITPGKSKDIEFKISIEVNSGTITVNKHDSENKDRIEATLKGAKYGIYKLNGDLFDIVETNEDGKAYISNIPLGEYYIKEINPSLGYELDTNLYYINITKENKNFIINSYENVIKGKIQINKYYGEDDNYDLEDGAIFELYDFNDNLINIYETKTGFFEDELEYGNYYLLQIKGKDGYKFVDKLNIKITEDKKYIFDLYNEREEVHVPNTFKTYYRKNYKSTSLVFIISGFILVTINIINSMIRKKTTS